MKKFIVIMIMLLASFVCNAQYNNQYIRQENATPAQWNEWKGLMSQYNKGRTMTYEGLTIGVIGMGGCYLIAHNAQNKLNEGIEYWNCGNAENGAYLSYQTINTISTIGMFAFGIGGAVAIIFGQLKKNDARHKLDRFYFNNGFVYTF